MTTSLIYHVTIRGTGTSDVFSGYFASLPSSHDLVEALRDSILRLKQTAEFARERGDEMDAEDLGDTCVGYEQLIEVVQHSECLVPPLATGLIKIDVKIANVVIGEIRIAPEHIYGSFCITKTHQLAA